MTHTTPNIPNTDSPVNQRTGRWIILDVFKTIIYGTLKDVFDATIGVIWKLLKHLMLCLWYFWSPDIDRPPSTLR